MSIAGGSVGFGLSRAQAAELMDVAVHLNDVDHVAVAKTARRGKRAARQ
jgi:hypothetical protein